VLLFDNKSHYNLSLLGCLTIEWSVTPYSSILTFPLPLPLDKFSLISLCFAMEKKMKELCKKFNGSIIGEQGNRKRFYLEGGKAT